MNIYFTRILKVGERQREFNFRKMPGDDQPRYHVDVTDDLGARHIFSMYLDAFGKWKTAAGKVPLWVHQAEDVLGVVIDEEAAARAN